MGILNAFETWQILKQIQPKADAEAAKFRSALGQITLHVRQINIVFNQICKFRRLRTQISAHKR